MSLDKKTLSIFDDTEDLSFDELSQDDSDAADSAVAAFSTQNSSKDTSAKTNVKHDVKFKKIGNDVKMKVGDSERIWDSQSKKWIDITEAPMGRQISHAWNTSNISPPGKRGSDGTRRSGQGVAVPAGFTPEPSRIGRLPLNFAQSGYSGGPSSSNDVTASRMMQTVSNDDDIEYAHNIHDDPPYDLEKELIMTSLIRDYISIILETKEEELDEFCAAGAGAVSGFSLPLGSQNVGKKKKKKKKNYLK